MSTNEILGTTKRMVADHLGNRVYAECEVIPFGEALRRVGLPDLAAAEESHADRPVLWTGTPRPFGCGSMCVDERGQPVKISQHVASGRILFVWTCMAQSRGQSSWWELNQALAVVVDKGPTEYRGQDGQMHSNGTSTFLRTAWLG